MNHTTRNLGAHRYRRCDQGGFTLIELLVVIVILGILSAVVVFAVRGSNDQATQNAGVTDERIVRTALEVYCARNGHYPKDPDRTPTSDGPKDAMQVLVDEKFLSDRSTYHSLKTGDETDLIAPFEGRCGTTPRHYKLEGPGGPPPPPAELGPEKPPVCGLDGGWKADGFCRAAYPGITEGRAIDLKNGKIFAVGCIKVPSSCAPTPQPGIFRAEIFDPSGDQSTGQGTWTQGGVATTPFGAQRLNKSAVLLEGTQEQCGMNCGKVLAHFQGGGTFQIPDVEIRGQWQLYNPDTEQWTPVSEHTVPVPALSWSTMYVRATLITGTEQECGVNCGKVLINRDVQVDETFQDEAVYELFDPLNGEVRVIEEGSPDWGGPQSRLPDGRILIVSRSDWDTKGFAGPEAKLFNPTTAMFDDADPPPASGLYREGALTLDDDRVLITTWNQDAPDGAALYTPESGQRGTWQGIKTCGTCELEGVAPDGTVVAFKYEGSAHVRLELMPDGTANWIAIEPSVSQIPGYGVPITGPPCRPNCGKMLLLGTGNPFFYTPPAPDQG